MLTLKFTESKEIPIPITSLTQAEFSKVNSLEDQAELSQ